MFDQAYAYVEILVNKVKEFHAPITLEDLKVLKTKAGLFNTDLNEYEIITRNSNSQETSIAEEDDELGYAVARSAPFARIHRGMDGASTSENHFPTLFHQQAYTLTSDSLSFIQRPFIQHPNPLHQQNPLDNVRWTEREQPENSDDESVYRKVADWVFSQRHYFSRFDSYDADDIEVIDPVDLFDDSLLNEYLVLTRSSSEKRILLRELNEHAYNLMSINEAMEKFEYDFLRKPDAGATMELSCIGMDAESVENDATATDVVDQDTDQPFLAVSSILNDYSIYDRDGGEVTLDDKSHFETSDSEESIVSDVDAKTKVSDANELDIVSLQTLPNNITFDEQTSITCPTDVFDITTAVIVDNASEETDTDIWEDAKDVPHWLDCEQEDQLFNYPHRPFYYYRDRIKGCYRIIGVEDETVVLFSGNDDDSIFYGPGKEDEVSALRRSHSLGLLSSSTSSRKRTKLFPSENPKFNVSLLKEKRNDSGIEDAEECILEEKLVETSLSAKESFELGRVTKIIRNKEPKTVTFKFDVESRRSTEYLFVVLAVICVLASIAIFGMSNLSYFRNLEQSIET